MRITKADKVKFTKLMLSLGAAMMTVYVAVCLVLAWRAGEQPNDALTYAMFGYWGVEGGWTMMIKKAEKTDNMKGEDHP